MRRLRKDLRRWVLAALPAASLTAGCASDCPPAVRDSQGRWSCDRNPDGGDYCQTGSADGGLPSGTLTLQQCQDLCPPGLVASCEPEGSGDQLRCEYHPAPCGGTGRRPEGLVLGQAPRGACAVGDYLARSAELEAASVPAFRRLAAELSAHGAPPGLRRRALSAGRDEVRHARSMARLAARHGARASPLRLQRPGPRALVELAVENAVEGCVRETFGAAVAIRQALTATDPAVRRALAGIADDEVRHAQLAWDIAAWAEAQLGPPERRRVTRARRAAARALDSELVEPAAALLRLGLPPRAEALEVCSRKGGIGESVAC